MRAVIIGLVLSFATTAVAEPTRSGLMLGGSLGAGGASACRDCDQLAGAAAELHIGYWINPQWAVSYEAWVFTGDTGQIILSAQGASLATVTTRAASRVWLKAGAGLALYTQEDPITDELFGTEMSRQYRGLGIGAGVGYELYQSPGSLVVDVSGRSLLGIFPDHGTSLAASALIGVSWN